MRFYKVANFSGYHFQAVSSLVVENREVKQSPSFSATYLIIEYNETRTKDVWSIAKSIYKVKYADGKSKQSAKSPLWMFAVFACHWREASPKN
jgi:hypothetical protein